ncbi:hypothetical protein ACFX5K_00610 [Rickettsiales bacterium LUAb2]
MENENYANPTPTEYFNHLVNNGLIAERTINNDDIGILVSIVITPETKHKLLMPQESHLQVLEHYLVDQVVKDGKKIDIYNTKPNPFIGERIDKLGFSLLPIGNSRWVHEHKLVYIYDVNMRTIEQYRRDVLPHVSFD